LINLPYNISGIFVSIQVLRQPPRTIIDDGLARKCAETYNIPLSGTLGIILLAKKNGLISKARPLMNELKQHGMYLHESTLNQALALVGE